MAYLCINSMMHERGLQRPHRRFLLYTKILQVFFQVCSLFKEIALNIFLAMLPEGELH